jgi:hypothetical protein
MQNIRVKGTIGRGNKLKHIDEVLDRSHWIEGKYYDVVEHVETFIAYMLSMYGLDEDAGISVVISFEE